VRVRSQPETVMSRAVREALDQELDRAYAASGIHTRPTLVSLLGPWTLSNVSNIVAHHFSNLVSAAREEANEDYHRWLLWEICPHEGKYGDDGQMQCNFTSGPTDFLRDELWRLQQHVQDAWEERKRQELPNWYELINARADRLWTLKWMERFHSLLNEISRGDYGFAGRPITDMIDNLLSQHIKDPKP
jgi:hypothetical protein